MPCTVSAFSCPPCPVVEQRRAVRTKPRRQSLPNRSPWRKPDAGLNGSGTRHKAVFKVYNAHLYLPHKAQSYAQIAQMPGAKRLEIHMLRDIGMPTELGKLFTKGIEHNTTPAPGPGAAQR